MSTSAFLFTDRTSINRTRMSLFDIDCMQNAFISMMKKYSWNPVSVRMRSVYECILRILMWDNDNRLRFIDVMSVNEKNALMLTPYCGSND